jgi:L-ascorbate metabolism protein UlaG (beta-lactamase superfamily)
MDNQLKYLKPNVVIEPLFDRWYAWSHLISPFTSAMNIVGRHLKIIDSYILAPNVHAAAVKNPKMLGGPFMDYDTNRVDEIKKLKERIVKSQKDNIELAAAIKALDKMLKENAKGYSLEPLYNKVPDLLKGYIELVYDLNGYPSFRVIETLVYKSNFFNKSSQSLALWLTENDSRPFVLSTPRLDEKNVVHVNIPFDHEVIDDLARMKRTPGTIEHIRDLLNVDESNFEIFNTFFTTSPMTSYRKYEGDKIRMRYFGHACIFIETKEMSILVDPLISYYGYQSDVSRFSDMDLPDTLDYILITHNHQDHILFETLLPLRHKTRNIIVPRSGGGALQDPSLKLMFKALGFKNVIEIDETLEFKKCRITGIPFTGEHSDLNIKAKTCHHVQLGKFSILFVADSRILEPKLYEHIYKEIGDVDVIFLGMECDGAPLTWLYGPLLTEELGKDKDITRRLSGSNCERGMHLVNIFNPKEVYVYAMGQEPWVEFISSVRYTNESNPIVESNRLINECTTRGIVAERLFGEKELLYNYDVVEAL